MQTRSMTFRQWYASLREPVHADFVPEILEISREEFLRAVRDGRLPIRTFRAGDGRVFRLIESPYIRLYNRNPLLTHEQMLRGFARLMDQRKAA
ncbi:MAG: hypothetical protein K8S99_01515 [Planctomycetes bacterium]|nr:hypothetical protein [Planctomycetota bacterium]